MALEIVKRFYDEDSFLEIFEDDNLKDFLKKDEEVRRKYQKRLNKKMEESYFEILSRKPEGFEKFVPFKTQRNFYDKAEIENKKLIIQEVQEEFERFQKTLELENDTKEDFNELGIDESKIEQATRVGVSDEVNRFKEFARIKYNPDLGAESCFFEFQEGLDEVYFKAHLINSLKKEKISDLIAMANNLREKNTYAQGLLEQNKKELVDTIFELNQQNAELLALVKETNGLVEDLEKKSKERANEENFIKKEKSQEQAEKNIEEKVETQTNTEPQTNMLSKEEYTDYMAQMREENDEKAKNTQENNYTNIRTM
ncbi:hypothetical protein BA917_08830 [Helicobacter pullorum]|uniref:hypothetical protein n=1 Tax=Helicobacter pullorum TaxID=35818 RepID=UPI000816AD25|nr:hypothetical protein [Helicobacter pullorum]OCR18294.1 hypothetical protein BA917_08830 [Helicobacter pullorum]